MIVCGDVVLEGMRYEIDELLSLVSIITSQVTARSFHGAVLQKFDY
jgi:hypothetical protein